jgi:transposase-like protein
MIVNDKNGISSYEVGRALAITQKSAWFMMHRIRLAMQRGGFDKFSGDVEADETFIGGKGALHAPVQAGREDQGSAVMGLLERHGPDGHSRVRVKHVPNTPKRTLAPEVREHVKPGANLYTDALKPHDGLSADYAHAVIDHAESYVRGNVHTNGLENFWSLLKRAIKGTYVSVEPFHLFRYLDEEAFRFNARKLTDAKRFLEVLRTIVGRRVTYAQLIGQSPAVAEA